MMVSIQRRLVEDQFWLKIKAFVLLIGILTVQNLKEILTKLLRQDFQTYIYYNDRLQSYRQALNQNFSI